MIYLIDKETFDKYLPLAMPFLNQAHEYAYRDYELEDLFREVREGRGFLFLDIIEKEIIGASIVLRENGGVLAVLLSTSMEGRWEGMMEEFENWAKGEGIKYIEMYGRLGWAKALKKHNFKVKYVILRKELEV